MWVRFVETVAAVAGWLLAAVYFACACYHNKSIGLTCKHEQCGSSAPACLPGNLGLCRYAADDDGLDFDTIMIGIMHDAIWPIWVKHGPMMPTPSLLGTARG